MERSLRFEGVPALGYGAPIDQSTEQAILSNAVELARHLAGGRIAWLMLPSKGPSPLRLAAVSEHNEGEQDETPTDVPPVRAIGRTPANVARQDDNSTVPMPSVLPFSRKTTTQAVLTTLTTLVPAGGGAAGMLVVAEPLSPAGFEQDALALLEMLAASVGHYLTLLATQEQGPRLQRTTRELQRQVIEAQEEERRRIARDLHDEIGHALSSAILRIDLAAMTLPSEAAQSRTSLEHARASLVESAEALHGIVFHLRPPILEDLGLAAALNRLVAQANEVPDTRITLTIEDPVRPLPEGLDLVLFRVVQEALTNIRKHARATEATVRLRYTAHSLVLRVEDNGIGFRGHAERTRERVGLRGMRERIKDFGGELKVASREGGGTALIATLPLPAAHNGGV